jgi:hypothetical protein
MTQPLRTLLTLTCLVLLVGPLGGCIAAAAVAGADAATVAIFGRDVVDIGVSAVTGRDCSVVRLDRQQDYCAPREHAPLADPYCSRTLGDVQCWSNPETFVIPPRQIADTPALTNDQRKQITSRWPKALNIAD